LADISLTLTQLLLETILRSQIRTASPGFRLPAADPRLSVRSRVVGADLIDFPNKVGSNGKGRSHGGDGLKIMLVQQGTRKEFAAQMSEKGGQQRRQGDEVVIVTDGLTGIFPHVLLGVEVWTTGREEQNLQPRMGGQKVANLLAFVPRTPRCGGGTAIPQQQNRQVRIHGQEHLQKQQGGDGVHDGTLYSGLLAGA